MATVYGLTTTGFVLKTADVIKSEWDESMRGEYGAGFNLAPETPEGQFVGIAVEREALVWEQIEAVAAATANPNGANGTFLDNLCSLTGTLRLTSSQSTVVMTCTGTAGTVLPQGRVASTLVVGSRFVTNASATIAALAAWQASHSYAIGDRVTNGGNAYQCVDAGQSAGAGGPSGIDPEAIVVDYLASWRFLGAGAGAVDAPAKAEDYGPVEAPARSLLNIETPVSGWSNVINVLDAPLGRNVESDAALRGRRNDLLRSQGLSAVDAVRAKVLLVAGVTSCVVFENFTFAVDADGRPACSLEALVEGGADADIAAAIWASKPGGIQAYGTTVVAVTDSAGGSRSVGFSRPADVDVYVTFTATKDPALCPSDAATIIADAVATWADDYHRIGKDVVSSSFVPTAFGAVPGMVDVPAPKIGITPSPGSSTTLAINSRSRARFDTSRIVVTLTNFADL